MVRRYVSTGMLLFLYWKGPNFALNMASYAHSSVLNKFLMLSPLPRSCYGAFIYNSRFEGKSLYAAFVCDSKLHRKWP